MVLELHIWGPAFDLPSIDAPCLAAICYLRSCLPADAWSLIPSSDPAVSPLGELPALRNGETWVSGFDNIVAYLKHVSGGEWDLDKDLDDKQRADRAALSSFLESRGQPLLDLYLYVSTDNYHGGTRQALAEILTWPNSWSVPHQVRAKAKKRSEHLGLSGLDVDTAQEDKKEDAVLTAQIPKSLRKPRQTVSGLLGRNMQKNRFRLDGITSDFFEPLLDALGEKEWFLRDQTSSVDCLALGYLALMQSPNLPQAWLKDALHNKYAKLDGWARKHSGEIFGGPVDVSVVLGRKDGLASAGSVLPWQVPRKRNLPQVLQAILENCVTPIPILGSWFSISDIGQDQSKDLVRHDVTQHRLAQLRRRRDIYVQLLASTCAITGLMGWMLYKGILHIPRRTPTTPKGRSFGEAGALLGLA
ncbi:hypothetical protein HRR83_006971 [Exophiala dermatitidis]|uniref:Mitochondrial outer membrane transport complex Sam37/metaxin N-terminal domain-containing protein n=2 Tax=Exophiala dermatitidis TaxID=5970 RepID=H6BKA3_EXODN|nr:uncharacterized protein HMPREF1120_00748 [Exophiala dermatitidis NIH/UT8656]KAJ4509711.1 hypothetical protein HRR75_005837 [Exophiala dermatitidis]EHY52537.1 hypothetical protein HMPREF1120_00748 [Exophiala dermatitidis NIH/UT8656]KAJ4512455.1 hypothetical protein HRR73_006010 [Exophiala dermatitidis]KAJ4512670.1 hypothetical protein HRR74_006368 [Exophiala dermatitidis]KAJ4542471.1 hypothetical protein HRR77_005672 [Exophiala dermatitidis]